MKIRKKSLVIAVSGMTAALYTVLTLLSAAFGLSSGVIQCRLSEALCILPLFSPAAIPGLTVGCIISNLITGGGIFDALLGSGATLLGAVGAYLLRHGKYRYFSPLPTVISNALIVPLILYITGGATAGDTGYLYIAATVGAGEIVSAYILGIILLKAVEKSIINELIK